MKKYIVFVLHELPNGGLDDIFTSRDNLMDAMGVVADHSHWADAYVVDRDTWERVS
jgi:hypothetical protein